MDIKEALAIMSSDFKLWERAEEEQLGGGKVAKTLTLPWGIGSYTVELEGLNDAGKRRSAVSAYGEHIRGVINERINDDAITSRAKAAAARSELASSEDSDSVSADEGLRDTAVPTEAVPGADEAHEADVEEDVDFGASLAARRVEVSEGIDRLTGQLDRLCKELRGIDAAIKAMAEEED